MALGQLPRAIVRRLPVDKIAVAAEVAKLLLPVAQGAGVQAIDLQQVEKRLRFECVQALLQALAKGAELRITAVAQGQDGVAQLWQWRLFKQRALKTHAVVRGLAVAVGADHQ